MFKTASTTFALLYASFGFISQANTSTCQCTKTTDKKYEVQTTYGKKETPTGTIYGEWSTIQACDI